MRAKGPRQGWHGIFIYSVTRSSTTSQWAGHYQLVSVTYVHGIMYGDYFERKKDARQVQSFTLY